MKIFALSPLAAFAAAVAVGGAHADNKVSTAHKSNSEASLEFKLDPVPRPAKNDAAARAKFSIVDGRRDGNGGNVEKLNDGALPTVEDEPSQNFFFAAGTEGGRLLIDLGGVKEISQVNTFSWHPSSRGPQVYKLYGSEGTSASFKAEIARPDEPTENGWTHLAGVDTRPEEGDVGGQHGASITASNGALGRYRYLLFDVSPTAVSDPFGHTFFSEIDVVEAGSTPSPIKPPEQAEPVVVETGDGQFRIEVDAAGAPDLVEWIVRDLAPVIKEWYPRLVTMLPSEGYEAPRRVRIVFDPDMRGVAAASGSRIRGAADWYRRNLEGEAKGSIVHELVHVAQQYDRGRRNNPNASRNPGWLVEGLADYIRWYLYEPESRGAEITARNFDRARYDASYRVTANFLNWVVTKHGPELIARLNAAMREGDYNEEFWKTHTGMTVQELGDAWRNEMGKRLNREPVTAP